MNQYKFKTLITVVAAYWTHDKLTHSPIRLKTVSSDLYVY